MSKNIHIMCVVMTPTWKKKYSFRWDYFLMTRYCLKSLLKTGFSPENVTCIAYSKNHCNILKSEFGINTMRVASIPADYDKVMSQKQGRKLFLYKPLCYSTLMPEPIDDNTIMVMTDVDALFFDDPTPYFSKLTCDVWSHHSYRYLRPSRKKTMKKNHIRPNLKKMSDLVGYFGSESQAYLFLRYGKKLPKRRLTSSIVAMQPNIYSSIISTYRRMTDDVIKTRHLKGDQEMLDAAVHHLELSYEPDPDFSCVKQYSGGAMKKIMQKDIKKLGIMY